MSELNNLWLFAQVLMKVWWFFLAFALAILVERMPAHAENHHRRLFLVPRRKQARRRENVLLVVRPSR